jgi:tetratricopeptide (TPR) repeat protein
MTAWKEIKQQLLKWLRIGNRSNSSRRQRQRAISVKKNKNKNRKKREVTPQEMIAILASIIIILMAFGGIGLVYNVFASEPPRDNGFLTYENPDYNIKVDYPANWTKSEINLRPYDVAFFYPTDLNRSKGLFESLFRLNIPPVSFVMQAMPKSSMSINESALRSLSSFEGNNQSRLIDHNHTILSGMPAYEIVYYDYGNDETRKGLSVWTHYNNDPYYLSYHTDPGYFNQYLPLAKIMIDSFQITPNNNDNNNNNTSVDLLPAPQQQQQGEQVHQLIQQSDQSKGDNSSTSAPLGESNTSSSVTNQLLEKGESVYKEGNYALSIKYYDEVLALVPNSTGALYDKGLALDMLGLHGDAITYYDKVLTVQPDNINALVNKGGALGDLGRYQEAIVYFDRALTLDPNNALAANGKRTAELYVLTDQHLSTK